MKIKLGKILMVVAVAFFIIPGTIHATELDFDLQLIGDIFYGNSWGQRLSLGGTTYYQIEMFIVNDIGSENVDFEAMNNFSEGGWNGNIINSNYALATGGPNTTSPIEWDAIFTGDPANQNFNLDVFGYRTGGVTSGRLGGLTEVRPGFFKFTSIGSIPTPYPDYDRTPSEIPGPVPEPTTMFLLGTGLVGVAGAARRKKKNQA